MKLSGAWLNHPGTQALCRALEAEGFRALFVGGCVRNALMGLDVSDIDISTDARPGTVTKIAEKAGFKAVPTGVDHGTVTIIAQGLPHEVTTFRRDVETFGRHAVVAFSDRIEDDAARRDFTMNALYADARGQVIDPLGGLLDLQARRVRFVGDAEQRIREDYLRILRFFRFHAHYARQEDGFEPDALAACAANSAGLETLSRERIGAEMRKLLSARDPGPAIATMAQAGILIRVLPGAEARVLPPFLHLEGVAELSPDPIARLAALGGDAPEEALRLSRAESRRMSALQAAAVSTLTPGALGYRLKADGRVALVLRAALLEQPLAGLAEAELGAVARFPLRAADLPGLQGAALGAGLKALESRWIDSGFTLTRDDLLA
ncbi:MAG: CCA tRNA nucleotidyltransferase [Cypionkella sp.]|jgi:poly(A) polymerase|nr:CCA tRNA nucleotidyltransferase [Cypionkella sp.]